MKRKITAILSVIILICSLFGINISAYAANHTQAEAVSWANSQVGKSLDYDGAYGYQCVDLTAYYYQYLGASAYIGGNACDYQTKSIPGGWSRIPYSNGITFKAGDIAVWKTNLSYQSGVSTINTTGDGHIGIIVSADSTGFNCVEQNDYRDPSHVKTNWHYNSELHSVIRPNFSASASLSFSNVTATPSETMATITFNTVNSSNATVTKVGLKIKKSGASSWEKDYSESISLTANPLSTNYVIGSGKEINYALSKGTKYIYQIYAVTGEKTFNSAEYSFTTKDSAVCSHRYTNKVTKEPTCTAKGVRTYTCSICGNSFNQAIAATGHSFGDWNTIKAATFTENGTKSRSCKVCGASESASISKIENIKLSSTAYIYNRKAKKPSVTVTDSEGKTLTKVLDYSVAYEKGRTNIGRYAVKVSFTGDYNGSRIIYFKIYPKSTTIKSLKNAKNAFTVNLNKVTTQTTGYQIQYSTSSQFTSSTTKTITVSKNSTTSKKVTGLKTRKTYYVRVRTYKSVNGTKYCSTWSKVKAVKTK